MGIRPSRPGAAPPALRQSGENDTGLDRLADARDAMDPPGRGRRWFARRHAPSLSVRGAGRQPRRPDPGARPRIGRKRGRSVIIDSPGTPRKADAGVRHVRGGLSPNTPLADVPGNAGVPPAFSSGRFAPVRAERPCSQDAPFPEKYPRQAPRRGEVRKMHPEPPPNRETTPSPWGRKTLAFLSTFRISTGYEQRTCLGGRRLRTPAGRPPGGSASSRPSAFPPFMNPSQSPHSKPKLTTT